MTTSEAAHEVRTAEEIETLKANWMEDPGWNIWETPGFEGHRTELKAWADDYTAKCHAAFASRQRQQHLDGLRRHREKWSVQFMAAQMTGIEFPYQMQAAAIRSVQAFDALVDALMARYDEDHSS